MRTTSEFMDKQIMELSRSYSDDFSQLTYPQPHHHLQTDNNDDDLLSGLHFQQHSRASTLANHGSMDQVGREDSRDSVLISVIDRKMSQHFGNLLHAVEGISARVSQMETRLRMVENSVGDLKGCTDVNYGKTDGKLREVENILRKLEGGMQDLKDEQEIAEAQLQLAKLQMAKDHEKLEQEKSIIQTILASAPQQMHQSYSAPLVVSAQHPSLPTDNAPTPAHQNFPPAPAAAQLPAQSYSAPPVASVQHPSLPKEMTPTLTHQNYPPAPPPAQLPAQPSQYQNPYSQQPDSNYSAPPLNPPPPPQAYNYMSQGQQSQPPPTAPYQPYQAGPHPSQTSHGQQQSQLHQPLNAPDPQTQYSSIHNPAETQYSSIHNPAETQYTPSQSYPQSIHRPSDAPRAILPLQQHFDGSMQYAPDRHSRNYSTDFSPGNGPPAQRSGHDDYYSHGRSSHYNDSKMHQSQGSPSSSVSSGGNSFSRLPTAKIFPYAVPMAASVDKESDSCGTGNRVPVDNVIDKVVSMGFRRDVVRATVRKMTENGQSVDLNVVLDKLMNSGEVQSQSGLYDR